jgi:tetratricopeptide (TPR) repeat protein
MLRAHAAVQDAERLRLAGKLDRAQSECAALLRQYPDFVAALQTMGLVLADRSQYERAVDYLHRAAMLNPHDPNILTGLGGVYLSVGANLMARRTLEQARQLAPSDVNILATLGEIYRAEKEYELSKETFEAALRIDPNYDAAESGLALSYIHIGELAPAAAILERRVRQGSRSVVILSLLSELPSSLVSVDLLAILNDADNQARAAARPDAEFLAHLTFAKAAALDQAARHDEAWTHLCEARRFKLAENRKRYGEARKRYAPIMDLGRRSSPNLKQSPGDPISLFIVGPSRSGKTSLELLVGSLAGVKRGYENPIVENAVRRSFQTGGLPTRESLIELPPPLGDLFRKFYGEELRKRAGPAKVLTNTLPRRSEDAWRAASEIPNARFIFIKRNVDDICLRIFMRHYESGNLHASDLGDTRDYVTFCHQMIDIMAERMPEISRVLSYEEMVADPAAARALAAELCNLETSGGAIPSIGDDRHCAIAYIDHIKTSNGESNVGADRRERTPIQPIRT